MALKDILSNAKYADDLVLTLPDGTTATVGEMRGFTATERQALIQRNQTIEAAEAGLRTRVERLRDAGLLDEQMNPILPRDTKTARSEFSASSGIEESDPLFGPMYKQFRSELQDAVKGIKAEMEQVSGTIRQLGGVTQQAVRGYLSDYYDQQFKGAKGSLPESVRDKYTLEKVIEYATTKKLTDANGRLDVALALDQLSWPDVKSAQLKEVEKTQSQVAEDRKALAQMSRPQMGRPHQDTGFKGTDDKGKTLSLDQAIAAAANDSDIWNSIGNTASGVIN